MREPLAPMLFDDHHRAAAEAERVSPVAKARVSQAAYRNVSTQRVEVDNGQVHPVHSFRTLMDDLATLTRNTVCFGGDKVLTVHATPTPVPRRAFSLLGVELPAAKTERAWGLGSYQWLASKSGKVRARRSWGLMEETWMRQRHLFVRLTPG